MIRRSVLSFSILVVIAVTLAAFLQTLDAKSRQFLPAGSVDIAALVPPPPAKDSAGFKEEMAVVLWLQRTRTPAQVEFARKDLDVGRFTPLLGDALLKVDGIKLKQTIDSVIDEVRADYDAIKAKYDVPRPFVENEDVKPVTEPRPVASYPSGHAIRAVIYARLLAEIFPSRKETLMELARQVGYGRVIAGVHYPMDIVTGQRLGNAFADVIIQQRAFADAIKTIQTARPAVVGRK